jgi:hypothetical protein
MTMPFVLSFQGGQEDADVTKIQQRVVDTDTLEGLTGTWTKVGHRPGAAVTAVTEELHVQCSIICVTLVGQQLLWHCFGKGTSQ